MKKLIAMVAFLLIAAVIIQAQTAEEVINRHIKAVGGKALIGKVKSVLRVSEIQAMGISVIEHEYQKQPNKKRREAITTEIAGSVTLTIEAFDGTNAWELNPRSGIQGRYQLPANYAEKYKSRGMDGFMPEFIENNDSTTKYLGTEELNGVEYDVVVYDYATKDMPAKAYFKRNDGVLVKIVVYYEGTIAIEITYSDYRKDAIGLLTAHTVTVKSSMQKTVTEFTEISYNIDLSDSLFQMNK